MFVCLHFAAFDTTLCTTGISASLLLVIRQFLLCKNLSVFCHQCLGQVRGDETSWSGQSGLNSAK